MGRARSDGTFSTAYSSASPPLEAPPPLASPFAGLTAWDLAFAARRDRELQFCCTGFGIIVIFPTRARGSAREPFIEDLIQRTSLDLI